MRTDELGTTLILAFILLISAVHIKIIFIILINCFIANIVIALLIIFNDIVFHHIFKVLQHSHVMRDA